MIEVPNPSEYEISPKFGFLSPDAPARSFRDPYYQPWDSIAPKLSTLIKSGQLDAEIDKIPILSTDRLTDEVEYRRAYVILAFLTHGHVWQNKDSPDERIPPQISEPFLKVCKQLGIGPVVNYSGLGNWNWMIRNGGGMELANLDTIASFTGNRGEAAFYHLGVLVEYHGGRLTHLLIDAIRAASVDNRETVLQALRETSETIVVMGDQFPKLRGVLDPTFFYQDHRPFMAGGKGSEEKGLPRGMVFERSDGSEEAYKLVGGSASQSALFPFLDYALGVHHVENAEFFEDMRNYMPGPHREFLVQVSKLPSLRQYVEAHISDEKLKAAYDDCMLKLKNWRGKHIAAVSKYIVQPAREAQRVAVVEKIEVTGASETDQEWELQGTGGSALIPFLRQSRDDTVGIAG